MKKNNLVNYLVISIVGICGVVGNPEHSIDRMSQKLIYYGDENFIEYKDERVQISIARFKKYSKDQAIINKDDTIIWLWGDIYGIQKDDEYIEQREDNFSDIEFLFKLYKENDLEFLNGINGEFVAIIYDKKNQNIDIISDPLNTHPIFFTRVDNGDLVFSTQLQSLPLYPSVTTSFDLNYLYQFFTYERVLGVKTPLKNIEEVHPATILTYDLSSKDTKKKIYWTPRYNPKKRPYSDFVEVFINLFQKVIKERIDQDLSYGLYLSGGSDSRLILATIKDIYPNLDLTCYHMNERMNREAKIAKKIAKMENCKFVFLEREEDYLEKTLEAYSPLSLLNGWFDQAHSIGFADKVRDEVDVLFNGLNAGTILQRGHMPKKSLRIPLINQSLHLPTFPNFKSLKDFVDFYIEGDGATSRDGKIQEYLSGLGKKEFLNSFRSEFRSGENHLECYGVEYPSFEDFFHSFSFYPITNDQGFIVYHSEKNTMITQFPFMDKRIVEFSLSLPQKFLLQKHIVNSAIKKINSSLAEIKHSNIGLPLKYPWIILYFAKQFNMAKKKLFPSQKMEGPWGDTAEIIREHEFVKKKIFENEDLIKNCNFLEWEEILNIYKRHVKGENKVSELFALLTFLENPVTKSHFDSKNNN